MRPIHEMDDYDRAWLTRVLGRIRIEGDCWVYTGCRVKKSGYSKIYYRTGVMTGSRAMLQVKLGIILSADENACHTCDNPGCINPEHLYKGNQLQNMQDAVDRDRLNTARGTRRAKQAKLTEPLVAEIKRRLSAESQRSLAKEFGVSHTVIYKVANGKQWQHVS